ncbi:MAG: chemotaxis response regulator protein-glutamate methylesterase [Zoogloea sp.]|nr:chemotaxis response regulator protein-glutamate methylesterase [Zoogloea sp.]
MKTRVLIVDDSAVMRSLLTEIVNSSPDLQAVGGAPDPLVAREMIKTLNPDVLTLDVEMPKMDGLDFLSRLMRLRPMPVVMISSLTERGSETTLQALELGAVDFVTKPRHDQPGGLEAYAERVCATLRAAAQARMRVRHGAGAETLAARIAKSNPIAGMPEGRNMQDKLIVIGASTGGTEAIKEVLSALPEQMPGILIVQHMPEMFTGSFARRLDGLCRLHVKEAEDGERIKPGVAYLAPGHSHLSVRRSSGVWHCELQRSEPVNRHRPSVDVLFHSAARLAGANALGVLLTGMGKDGAQGLLAMRQAGAWTIAQDQDSCVVYGMPREAAAIGAVDEVLPLREIPQRLLARLRAPDRRVEIS